MTHIIERLKEAGISDEDISVALRLQETQRQARVPVAGLGAAVGRPDLDPSESDFPTFDAVLRLKPRKRSRGGLHVTKVPVHADSVPANSPADHDFCRSLPSKLRKDLKRAAFRAFDRALEWRSDHRTSRRDLAPQERLVTRYTAAVHRVLLALLDQEEYRNGKLYPCYETIAKWARCSRSTAIRAINTLAALGVVEWLRRYVHTKDPQTGARSEQTSNVYRLTLPRWLRLALGMDAAPTPSDVDQHQQEQMESYAAMLASAPAPERRRVMPTDVAGRARLIIGAYAADQRAVTESKRRECHKDTEPHPNIYNSIGMRRNWPNGQCAS